MADETGWVIERTSSLASAPEYLSFRGVSADDPINCTGRFDWFSEHIHAIRFARREDAIRVLGAVRSLFDKLPLGETLHGLRSNEEPPRVCEHIWVDNSAVHLPPPPDDSGLVKALEEEIEHHLSWITNYAKSTTENNWRDMAARIENQAALLRETLRALKTKEVNGAPPEPENDELDHFWEMDRSGKLVRVDIPPKEPAR